MHRTIPKGIVGGFEFTVLQRKLIEWHERPWPGHMKGHGNIKESRGYWINNLLLLQELLVSHITFRDCCVSGAPSRTHFFLQPFSKYRKFPKISPGAYIFQRPFLRGLFLEGLIYGGKFARVSF